MRSGWNVKECNETFKNFVANEMAINLNMLCALMKGRVLCDLDCGLTVTEDNRRERNKNVEVLK